MTWKLDRTSTLVKNNFTLLVGSRTPAAKYFLIRLEYLAASPVYRDVNKCEGTVKVGWSRLALKKNGKSRAIEIIDTPPHDHSLAGCLGVDDCCDVGSLATRMPGTGLCRS
jgi:hypothetical protein